MGWISRMPGSITLSTSGRAMTMEMACGKCTCNTCEGTGAGLRTFLRPFRGVHKAYLHLYVTTYEALVNAKRVSPALICRMCWPPKEPPHAYWT
jgi:transposase-like protein